MTIDIFESRLLESWPFAARRETRCVLAVSGGTDSSAMLCAFARLGKRENLRVLHVNHQLRGEESEEDARFTARLAEKYEVSFREERIDPEELRLAALREGSVESGARTIRYRLLLKYAEGFGARYILTAHHADDQVETILYRLFRGSGIDGLVGMSPFRPLNDAVVLARPFLSFSRADLTDYLTRLGESWRVDSSNRSAEFLRNRIRHELIPLLNDLFPGRVDSSIRKFASHAADLKEFLDAQLDAALAAGGGGEVLVRSDGSVVCSVEHLAKLPPILLSIWFRRLWRDRRWPMRGMDASRWSALAQMVSDGVSVRRELPGGLSAELYEGEMRLSPVFNRK
ncbi:MAG: tRNA lysidine(34) synthetase TilS [Thermoguttaceae bacterium]